MSRKILTTPINNEDLDSLMIGDIIYLTGYLVTSRDDVHQRLIKQHKPRRLTCGKAIFHAGPIMQEIEGQREVRCNFDWPHHQHAYGKI